MKTPCQNLPAFIMILLLGIFSVGCNSSGHDNAPLDDADLSVNPPSSPTNLQALVYSSTAIELAWNTATDDGTVVEYQVYRDGSLIATQSRLRFYENVLTAGTTHTYNVLAVDDTGNLSDPADLVVTTLNDGPTISEANYSVILPYLVTIANGKLFDDLRAIVNDTDASWLSGNNADDNAGLTLVDQAMDPTGIWRIDTYDCGSGGVYEYQRDTFIQFGGHFKGNYVACEIGSNNISGDFDRKATVNKAPPYNEILSSQYNITVTNDSRGSTRNLTGQIIIDNSQVDNRLRLIEASYFEHNLMWSTTISDIDIDVYATDEQPLAGYAVPYTRSVDANFRVQGPQTSDEPVTVDINIETNDTSSLHYQSGSLAATAGDGSSMRMTLSNSDLDTFQVSFTHAGSSSALTVDWSDDYRLLCFQTPTLDTLLTRCN